MSLFDIPEGYETRMRIVRALNDLLRDCQSIEKVTVSSLCSRAEVSRQTFYRHFESKYEVARWYYSVIIGQSGVAQIGRTLTCYQGLLSALKLYYDDRLFIKSAFEGRNNDYEMVYAAAVASMTEGIRQTVTDYAHAKLTPALEYCIAFCAKSLTMAISDWAREGFSYPPEILADYLVRCTPAELRVLLDRNVE